MRSNVLREVPFIILVLFFCMVSLSAQSIVEERKKIVGSWLSEEGSWKFIFAKDGLCKEYIEGKLEDIYAYKITPAHSACGRNKKVGPQDSIITFIEMTSKKDKEQSCYEIYGLTDSTLSITSYARPTLFRRVLAKSRLKKRKG